MTNLSIDTILESMIYSHAISDYSNIMFLLIPIFIIGIVLMANISEILDSDLDLLGRLKQTFDERPRTPTNLDLNYTKITDTDGTDYLFVFDKLDTHVTNMFFIFRGYADKTTGYMKCNHGGFNGYRKSVDLNTSNESLVREPLTKFTTLEGSGAHVLSNGLPIGREISGSSILLYVKEIRA